MADTQRTRAEILVLAADNVSGQISPQDFRDILVTIMNVEFANVADFWKEPDPAQVTVHGTGRGWFDYSQTLNADTSCSFGTTLYLNASGTWGKADVAVVSKQLCAAIAMDSYASGAATVQLMRKGIIYDSTLTPLTIGGQIYLHSGTSGSLTQTKTTSYVNTLGQALTAVKYRFNPSLYVDSI